MRKVLKWMAFGLVTLLVIIVGFLYFIGPYINGSDKVGQKIFGDAGLSYSSQYLSYDSDSLHYVSSGNDTSQTLIVFFHGAPGSWADFSSFLVDSSLVERTMMVAMDRYGYGGTRYGRIEKSIVHQVDASHHIVKKYPQRKIILAGYSYGGPVAALYAAKHPDNVKALLLLAPVVHPDEEKIFWFNHLIDINLIRYLLPAYISAANDEKLSHAESLNEIRDEWNQINIPVIHLHCTDDWIAPFQANTNWTRHHIDSNLLTIVQWEGDNHFLPNHIADRIKPILYELVK